MENPCCSCELTRAGLLGKERKAGQDLKSAVSSLEHKKDAVTHEKTAIERRLTSEVNEQQVIQRAACSSVAEAGGR